MFKNKARRPGRHNGEFTMQNNPDPQFFEALAGWFAALADPSRLTLVWRLKQGEASVNALVEETGIGQASVSKHLAILRSAGMVTMRKAGRQSIYFLAEPALLEICGVVCGTVARRHTQLAETIAGAADIPSSTRS